MEFSFTAGELDPTREEEGEGGEGGGEAEGGLFTIGGVDSSSTDLSEKERVEEKGDEGRMNSSPSHVDELRQRRLQRFHSMPTATSTVETESVKTESDRTDQ